MRITRKFLIGLMGIGVLSLTACDKGGGGLFSGGSNRSSDSARAVDPLAEGDSTIWDLFGNKADPNTTVEVNKYIWNAALDVLSFLPVEAADPFTGIIVFGYGTPPGSNRTYKATVYVRDPALDARSLNVALYTRSGPASAEATHAIEDAILTRARQLRVADGNL